jgi:hypothetical protein
MSIQPVGKDILLYKLFDSESANREGSQRCISRTVRLLFLSHTMPRCLNVSV